MTTSVSFAERRVINMEKMNSKDFGLRLAQLRLQKDVSARDMSYALGRNNGYINGIETGKSLPSMKMFFEICDYLNLSPKEFFDLETPNPDIVNRLMKYSKTMNEAQLESLTAFLETLD